MKVDPVAELILRNQHAIMTALQNIALGNSGKAAVPILSYQLKMTDLAITHRVAGDELNVLLGKEPS